MRPRKRVLMVANEHRGSLLRFVLETRRPVAIRLVTTASGAWISLIDEEWDLMLIATDSTSEGGSAMLAELAKDISPDIPLLMATDPRMSNGELIELVRAALRKKRGPKSHVGRNKVARRIAA